MFVEFKNNCRIDFSKKQRPKIFLFLMLILKVIGIQRFANFFVDCSKTQSGARERGAGMDRIDSWQEVSSW